MESRITWSCCLLLAPGISVLSGCGPSSPDADGSGAVDTPQAFQRSLEGIWSTDFAQGVGSTYAIEYQSESGLRVVRNGIWLDGKVEDIDFNNQTLALHIGENGLSETVTLRKMPIVGGGFTLRVTHAGGQADELGFVRRLTDRDRQEIGMAISQEGTVVPATSWSCDSNAPGPSLRARLACSHEDFRSLDGDMREQLVELLARYPDGDRTAAAAIQQLDTCDTQACLREVYAQWRTYFKENYDLYEPSYEYE